MSTPNLVQKFRVDLKRHFEAAVQVGEMHQIDDENYVLDLCANVFSDHLAPETKSSATSESRIAEIREYFGHLIYVRHLLAHIDAQQAQIEKATAVIELCQGTLTEYLHGDVEDMPRMNASLESCNDFLAKLRFPAPSQPETTKTGE